MLKVKLIDSFLRALNKSYILDLALNLNFRNIPVKKCILAYHETTGKSFRNHMIFLQKKFNIVHLEDILKSLESGDKTNEIVISFDDGARSFYSEIFPIIEEMDIPVINYIITSLIQNGDSEFWWLKARRLNKLGADLNTKKLSQMTYSKREKLLADNAQAFSYQPTYKDGLSIKMIREMNKSPLVTFGSHSVHHANFFYEQKKEIFNELVESKKSLENILDQPVVHFSYPNGEYRNEHIELVHKAHYQTAVTSDNMWLCRGVSLHSLPRITVGPYGCSVSWLKYRIFKTSIPS